MAYCTGRCMCHAYLKIPFEVSDVTDMVDKVFAGRVTFHDGVSEIAPNLTVHRVGGHSRGLQVVRVLTRRGWVVLGSDAAAFLCEFHRATAVPGPRKRHRHARGIRRRWSVWPVRPSHIIPGHDPLVLKYYPAAIPGVGDIVRLDAEPIGHA